MTDQCLLGRVEGFDIAVAYGVVSATVGEAIRRHDCDPVAAHLLGRSIAAGVLAAASLGEGQRLNIRWAYEGLLRTIVVDCGPDGATRAFIAPAQLGQAENSDALYGASGSVQVIRTRKGAVVAHGSTSAELLDVVDDLGYFLCMSDQTESALAAMIALSSNPEKPVHICRGILLQALPGCDLARFQRVRDRLAAPAARELLSRREESDSLVENILRAVLFGEEAPSRITLKSAAEPRFQCSCTRAKMGSVLRALPYSERMDIVRKQEPVVVNCRFCGERYSLSIDECIQEWNRREDASPATGT
ncbi:MAG: Hsp33 family molecular chaperone HslO [Kiritimatiellae bacterium]|nr:Hsp33 family molecular chaperone HslO [Kiritimatiellia bacterium]